MPESEFPDHFTSTSAFPTMAKDYRGHRTLFVPFLSRQYFRIFTRISAVFSFVWFSISLFVCSASLLEPFRFSLLQSAHKLQLKTARWSFSICFLSLYSRTTRKGIFRIFFHFRLWILLHISLKFHSLHGFVLCTLTKFRGRIAWQWHGERWFGIRMMLSYLLRNADRFYATSGFVALLFSVIEFNWKSFGMRGEGVA